MVELFQQDSFNIVGGFEANVVPPSAGSLVLVAVSTESERLQDQHGEFIGSVGAFVFDGGRREYV